LLSPDARGTCAREAGAFMRQPRLGRTEVQSLSRSRLLMLVAVVS
jgi:hypothetical protein